MKTLNYENFSEIVLSNEEMINVRGGSSANENPERPPVIVEL